MPKVPSRLVFARGTCRPSWQQVGRERESRDGVVYGGMATGGAMLVVVTARTRGSVEIFERRVVVTALQIRGALSWLPWHIAKSTDLVRSRC
jgi:hypothetical protein